MYDEIANYDGRIAKIEGCARGGKTQALVERCRVLVEGGTSPERILFEVTSAQAAQNTRRRLAEAIGAETAARVRVATALDECVRVLDTPEAVNATGRVPRLLNGAEYKFLLEDVRTLGLSVRRIRRMLRFFYAQWAKFENEENWLREAEEQPLADLVRGLLVEEGGMLREEAAFICGNYLLSDVGEGARHAYDCVLCDDFQNLSAAEQTCMCVLAGTQLVVAGNPNEVAPANTKDPNPEGFSGFERNRAETRVFRLDVAHGNPKVIAFADALADCDEMDAGYRAARIAQAADAGADEADEGTGQGGNGIAYIKWKSPEEELNGLTKDLRSYADAHPGLLERDIAVLVPTMRWARVAEKTLRQRGFRVSIAGAGTRVGGDPRESKKAAALVAHIKLNLLAAPRDMVAWRCWCGLDNHLTNSDIWQHLREYASERDLGLYEALEQVAGEAGEPFLRASELKEKFARGRAFIEGNAGRRGFNLLNAIGADSLPAFEDLMNEISGDETAARLFELEQQATLDPAFPDDPHTLRITTYRSAAGIEARVIYAFACVDGLIPARDAFEVVSTDENRARILNEERKLFHTAVAKAREKLVLSYFSRSDLELAERSKMQVVRVRAEGGARIALLRPCTYIGEAGAAAPGSVSGEAVLADRGLA